MDGKPALSRKTIAMAVLGSGLAALALKLTILLLDAVPFNSDEAIVALMARHMLQGQWSVFFYGQAYMGSLDAMLVALGFRILGEHVAVIRLIQALLYLATISTTVLLAARIFGSAWVVVGAGILMAVPSVNVTLYTTASLGGYGEALLLGNLILLATLKIREQTTHSAAYFAWGVFAGLGLWAFGLTLVYVLPSACCLTLWTWRALGPRQSLARLGFVVFGAVVGAAPWWIWSLENGLGPLVCELAGSAIAGASPSALMQAFVFHLSNLVIFGITVIIGLRPPWEIRPLLPVLLPLAAVFWLAALGHLLQRTCKPSELRPSYRLLAGVVATLLIGFVVTPFGADPSGRYFLPLATPMAISGADLLDRLRMRLGHRLPSAILLLVVGYNLGANLEVALRKPPGLTTQFDPVTRIDRAYDEKLIDFLLREGETRGYTNYWVAYPLAFLSGERLIFVPRLPYHQDLRYTERDDRYEPYSELVEASPKIAYITTHHEPLNQILRASLREAGVSWQEEAIGDYRVFYRLSEPVRPDEMGIEPR